MRESVKRAHHDFKTRDAVVSGYGTRTATDLAAELGISRNTVISMWRLARVRGDLGGPQDRGAMWGVLKAENARLTEALAAARAEAEDLREALAIEREPACGSCGVKVTVACPRGADHACFRDFHGGTRAARAGAAP